MQKMVGGLPSIRKRQVARKIYVNKDWPPGMNIKFHNKNDVLTRHEQARCLTAGISSISFR